MAVIKSITIGTENCESFTFPVNVFGQCYINNIHTEIRRVAINAICKDTYADEVALCIFFPEAEAAATREGSIIEEDDLILDRFCRFADITDITIHYIDDTEEVYLVDYRADGSYLGAPNLNQTTYVSSCGDLYIVISENKGIDDFFDKAEIENRSEMDFVKRMMCEV